MREYELLICRFTDAWALPQLAGLCSQISSQSATGQTKITHKHDAMKQKHFKPQHNM